ncbi:hypothetical protein SAMN05445850_0755 [Paraburkholderia tuberum]|uniref:Uncharacterized protein n=1 Tax=Paraburkholderia tuberum TaxID=157910 RepID=A0A1H1B7C8_9BURK|nr:hypothetical protein SAMN05445850_0755 [Paraburkholderia tuberum]
MPASVGTTPAKNWQQNIDPGEAKKAGNAPPALLLPIHSKPLRSPGWKSAVSPLKAGRYRWADYLDRIKAGAEVIPIKGGTVALLPQRDNHLEQRRPMMEAWAVYVCGIED